VKYISRPFAKGGAFKKLPPLKKGSTYISRGEDFAFDLA
jgi:hypothetical protein